MAGTGSLLLLLSITFTASPRYSSGVVNEPVYIDVVIEGENLDDVPEPVPPRIEHFKSAGRSVYTSTSLNYVNGKFTRTESIRYTYTYIPEKSGNFTIPPFILVYKGKTYKTEPFSIEIKKGSMKKIPAGKQVRRERAYFIKPVISRDKVYIGEGIVVEYKLYSIKPITGIQIREEPDYNGFWKEVVYTPKALDTQIEILNGVRYHTITLKKILLYPLNTGKITIPGPTVDIEVASSDFFDLFGKTYRIVSDKATVTVKPLPENPPESFTGGVGEFKLRVYFEKDTVMAGAGANLVVEVKGKGNLRFLTAPEVKEATGTRVYKPEEEVKANFTGTGESGKKIFKYLIVPLTPGIKKFPELNFSYFSPRKKQYITLTQQIPELVVYSGGTSPEKEKRKGEDIAFIKTGVNGEKSWNLVPPAFFPVTIIFTILPLIALIVDLERRKREKDIGYARLKSLPGITRRAMKDLKKSMASGDSDAFFTTLHKLLLDFIKFRFNKEVFGLSTEEIERLLYEAGRKEESIKEFIGLLKMCEEIRYAPYRKTEINLQKIYSHTREVLNALS